MMISTIHNMKTSIFYITISALGLVLAGCGGGGGNKTPRQSITVNTNQPNPGSTDTAPGSTNMATPGEWKPVVSAGTIVGYEHTGYKLRAGFDARGNNPTITASGPMHQPTVAGTWSGKWSARYTDVASDYGAFDRTAGGAARIDVTMAGNNAHAALTYSGINIQGLPSSVSMDRVQITNGRFMSSITLSIPTETGGRTSSTFRGVGQFGGAKQNGVVGYVSGQDFRSVFYGDRQ